MIKKVRVGRKRYGILTILLLLGGAFMAYKNWAKIKEFIASKMPGGDKTTA